VDVAVDTSALSEMDHDSGLLDRVCGLVEQYHYRLAIPLPVVSEATDANNPQGVLKRLRVLVTLSDRLGSRFLITQHVGDFLRIERQRRIHSTPRLPIDNQERIVESIRSGRVIEDFANLRDKIQQEQRKRERLDRDRRARVEVGNMFAHLAHKLPDALDQFGTDPDVWSSLFADAASKRGKYKREMKQRPRRYASAIVKLGYSTLIVFGVLFPHSAFGKYSDVLNGPKPNEWTDQAIAVTAAHARFFLSEDVRQCAKLNFVATKFGLRVLAISTSDWLERHQDRGHLGPGSAEAARGG
jgi:hypothetical protein